MNHEDGDQHDGRINGDGDHHLIMGHTVSLLCECRSYCSTFTYDNDCFRMCDIRSRTIP